MLYRIFDGYIFSNVVYENVQSSAERRLYSIFLKVDSILASSQSESHKYIALKKKSLV